MATVKDAGPMVTRDQLIAYSKTLSPGMVVTAPVPVSPKASAGNAISKKEVQNISCMILEVYPHIARVQGLNGEGEFYVPYIDLFVRNKVPQEILQQAKFAAPKTEKVVEEDWSDLEEEIVSE